MAWKSHPFSIPHDAVDPVGYRFNWGETDLLNLFSSLAWVTDIGHLNQRIVKNATIADILVLEANYDQQLMAEDEKRPMYVKERALGQHGHLDNKEALRFLKDAP